MSWVPCSFDNVHNMYGLVDPLFCFCIVWWWRPSFLERSLPVLALSSTLYLFFRFVLFLYSMLLSGGGDLLFSREAILCLDSPQFFSEIRLRLHKPQKYCYCGPIGQKHLQFTTESETTHLPNFLLKPTIVPAPHQILKPSACAEGGHNKELNSSSRL